MRLPPATVPLLIVFTALAMEIFAPGAALEYRRPALPAEPWRLFTAHFVHLSLLHAVLNCVALLLLARLFEHRLRPAEQWLLLAATPVAISLVFWIAMPGLAWYRGLSGVLHAYFFAGCVAWTSTSAGRARWLPIAALAAGALKVLLEQPWDMSFPFREWLGAAVVPQSHLAGSVVGAVVGLLLVLRRRRRPAGSPS